MDSTCDTSLDNSIENIVHPTFKYIYIPERISDDVQELSFTGIECDFQNTLKAQICSNNFIKEKHKEKYIDSLKKSLDNKILQENISSAVQSSHTYQIIPLTLPCQKNNFYGVNAYIDNIGRYKKLWKNSRASQVCSDEILGPCFISRTYDDEITFKRVDYTLKDYENHLKNPISDIGRWKQSDALNTLVLDTGNNSGSINSDKNLLEDVNKVKKPNCSYCGNVESEDVTNGGFKLKKCTGCQKNYYCGVECQRADWIAHKYECKS